ncbi:hypothetical protein F4777DRAFT_584577 [Nemania sp. FL0916]|nr:hypothetical protein F4777DRAFT_584577 [Nemania sp. FL0916]
MPPYLCWKVDTLDFETDESDVSLDKTPESSGEPTPAETSASYTGNAFNLAEGQSEIEQVISSIHEELQESKEVSGILYATQHGKTVKDIDILIDSFSTSNQDLLLLCQNARGLVQHFITTGRNSELELKFWGALHGVLLKYLNLEDGAHLEPWDVQSVSNRVSKMLKISMSIRTGAFGAPDRLILLRSLVNAFRAFVETFCLLNDYLKAFTVDEVASNNNRETMENEPRTSSFVGAAKTDLILYKRTKMIYEGDDNAKATTINDLEEDSDETHPSFLPAGPMSLVDSAFSAAENDLLSAKWEIVEMFATKNWSHLARYVTVGSSEILISALDFLANGDTEGISLEEIYQKHCSELRLKVRESPTRELLNDLDRAKEEMDSIMNIIYWQRWVLDKLLRKHFVGLRKLKWYLRSTDRMLQKKLAVHYDLKIRVEAMRKQILRQIDLRKDNNNKAITIFTVVTVLFLPLSFSTSYLGMNTVDIRNTQSGQGLFWAISVPVTVAVVGLAMTIAYQGRHMRELILKLRK